MEVTRDIEKNKQTIIGNIGKAAREGATFLVTPEGALSGYYPDFDQEALALAMHEVVQAAKDRHIGLFLGTCYKENVRGTLTAYNQVRVYAPDGTAMGVYSKILLCSPIDHPGTGEMLDYGQGYLNVIEWGGIRFGILICNDMWATPGYTTIDNPYLPLKLKQSGAELIIHCINSGSNQRYRNFHESSVELWAYSLSMPIMEVNAANGMDPVNAQSGLINEEGLRTLRVPESGEQLFICEIEVGEKEAVKLDSDR